MLLCSRHIGLLQDVQQILVFYPILLDIKNIFAYVLRHYLAKYLGDLLLLVLCYHQLTHNLFAFFGKDGFPEDSTYPANGALEILKQALR